MGGLKPRRTSALLRPLMYQSKAWRSSFANTRKAKVWMLPSSAPGMRVRFGAALNHLRPKGQYTQVGICGREIQFPIDLIFYKQLTMRGSICYTAKTWDRMMKIYEQGRVRLNDLVSTKLPIVRVAYCLRVVYGQEGSQSIDVSR